MKISRDDYLLNFFFHRDRDFVMRIPIFIGVLLLLEGGTVAMVGVSSVVSAGPVFSCPR